MRVWAWALWIQSEGPSVQRSGKGRGRPVFANPSLWTELELGLAELLGLAFLALAGGRPLSSCGSFWVSWPTRNPSHSPSTGWAPTGGDCEKVKHGDITQGLGCACVLSHSSRVQLFATLWVPLSMGCARQEYWSGLPYLSPGDLPYPGIQPRLMSFPLETPIPLKPSLPPWFRDRWLPPECGWGLRSHPGRRGSRLLEHTELAVKAPSPWDLPPKISLWNPLPVRTPPGMVARGSCEMGVHSKSAVSEHLLCPGTMDLKIKHSTFPK